MLAIVLFFLSFAFLIYALLAGADFGAGIIELFSFGESRKKTKHTIYRVIGPVWEANHIWLIIVIVILWVGFPGFYHKITTYLHLPITLVLLGITLRGVAFVVRHYDAYKGRSQIFYDRVFMLSSLVTPIGLGMTFGAIFSGEIIITESYEGFGFKTVFLDPWFNVFTILCGLFYASLCAFFSSVLLIGESDKEGMTVYIKKAVTANIISVLIGFLFLLYGFFHGIEFVVHLVTHRYFIVFVVISFFLLYALYEGLFRRHVILTRTYVTIQLLSMVMFPVIINYPDLMLGQQSSKVSILEGMASQGIIDMLAIVLLIGSTLILPGLFYLFKSFDLIKILKIKSESDKN